MLKKILIAAGVLSASVTVTAGPLDFYYFQQLEKNRSLRADLGSVQVKYFPQLIDHNHPKLGTFMQRVYVDDTFAKSNQSPVFFYICGESTCYPSSLSGEIRTMAEKYHARLVALEHRYYGKSVPSKSFSTSDLKYLSTDYALKDLARFQMHMMQSEYWNGKWIAFGGSYPGSLSAYYRLKYPDLVSGSLASSAPVRAKEDFAEYDAHVTQVAGVECASKMRAAYQDIEKALSDENKLASIKHSFGVDALEDNQDFLFLVADIGAVAVQYGFKPLFCDLLNKYDRPLTGYAEFAQFFYDSWQIVDPISVTTQGAVSENPADYEDGLGMRQWYYQSCKEYGYWQNANRDPEKSTRSSLVNADYFRNMCKRLFGITEKADTDYINRNFYQPLMTPVASNIFFTNGSTDPWSLLSMSPRNGNATNSNLDYYVINGAAHCDDLRTPHDDKDSKELKQARIKLSEHIASWLAA